MLPSVRETECMGQFKKNNPVLFYHCTVLSLIRIDRFRMCHLLDSPAAVLGVYLPALVSSPSAEDAQVSVLWPSSGTAAPGSWRNALVCETKLQRKCSVTLSEGPAVVIWDRVQLSLCDQTAFVRFSDNNLHRDDGWFSHTLCASMGKEHQKPTLKLTVSTPVTTVGQANSRLVCKLMCLAEWRRTSWTIWESDMNIHSLIWGFDCLRGSLRLWEQREARTGIPELAGLLSLLGWVTQSTELNWQCAAVLHLLSHCCPRLFC